MDGEPVVHAQGQADVQLHGRCSCQAARRAPCGRRRTSLWTRASRPGLPGD